MAIRRLSEASNVVIGCVYTTPLLCLIWAYSFEFLMDIYSPISTLTLHPSPSLSLPLSPAHTLTPHLPSHFSPPLHTNSSLTPHFPSPSLSLPSLPSSSAHALSPTPSPCSCRFKRCPYWLVWCAMVSQSGTPGMTFDLVPLVCDNT